jgi:hypothetical protein
MLRWLLLAGATLALCNEAMAQEYVGSIYYRPGGIERTYDHEAEIRRIAARLNNEPTRAVAVVGHTARQTDEPESVRISNDRAENVWWSLTYAGVDADRITQVGEGQTWASTRADSPRDNRADVYLASRMHIGGTLPSTVTRTYQVKAGGREVMDLGTTCRTRGEGRILYGSTEPDLVFQLDAPGHTGFQIDTPFEVVLVLYGEGSITCLFAAAGVAHSLPSLPAGTYRLHIAHTVSPDPLGNFTLRVGRSPVDGVAR